MCTILTLVFELNTKINVIVLYCLKGGNLMSLLERKILSTVAVGSICTLISGFSGIQEVEAEELLLKASSIEIKTAGGVNEAEIRRLLPELEKENITISKLSKNIQIVNDTGTMHLKAQFQPEDDGTYHVIILAEDKDDLQYTISVNDTGNENSGNWRTAFSYTDTDLSKNADMINLSYTTSPNNQKNVHQGSAFYKCLFPNSGDSAYVNFSFSNVDMGSVSQVYGLDLYTTGESKNIGVHYQHNFKYTSTKKQVLDVGFDYKKSKGDHELKYGDTVWVTGGYDIEEKVFSATYTDTLRRRNDSFSYNIGYSQNVDGNKEAYNNYRTGSDDIFHIFKAGVNYQYRADNDWIFNARLNGQYTTDNLISTEQISSGGLNGVRGFKESVASGDNGIRGSIEVYTPAILKNQRIVVFTDFANLSNNTYNIGERSKNLASIGLGYRMMGLDGWSVSLDYARPISSTGVNDSYHKPWHLSITKTF